MLPHLACDWDEAKQRFPALLLPKIDGVRGLNMEGQLTGRSLKPHANRYTTKFYSGFELMGLDGELAAEDERHPDLCRLTTSAVGTIAGEPFTLWHLFDYITESTINLPYYRRHEHLVRHADSMLAAGPLQPFGHLRVVGFRIVNNLDELNAADDDNLDNGYEGSIIRDPNGLHKDGRCTLREGAYLRIKRFIDSEAVVIGIEQGQTNTNAAQINELGGQFRTTHADGMVPNGQVGAMLCRALADVFDPLQKTKLLIAKGQEIIVAPGRMPVALRKYYFEHQNELLGQTIKYKFFPKGMKDKPRFPTYQSHRAASDIS